MSDKPKVPWRDLADYHRAMPGTMLRAELKWLLTLAFPLIFSLGIVGLAWIVEWVL